MATSPTYASTPRWGSVQLANSDSTTESGSAMTGVAAGTRIKEIRLCTGPTTAPGGTYKVAVKVYDGTNSRVVNVVTLSNAVDTEQAVLVFNNLILPSTSHQVRFQMRTALASGATLDCTVMGQDLT